MAFLPTRLPIFLFGERLISGEGLSNLMNWLTSANSGYVALAGGGQAGATLLSSRFNRVTSVVTAADSFMLPTAQPGLAITVFNRGGNSCQVFGSVNDMATINGTAGSTGIAVANGAKITFVCSAVGFWDTLLSA